MTEVLQRYRIVIIILGFIMIATLIWFILSKQSTNKIPSRGVFVMQYYFNFKVDSGAKSHVPIKFQQHRKDDALGNVSREGLASLSSDVFLSGR